MSDSHGRDHEMTAELALAASGKFLAVRITGYGNVGAWLNSATTIPPTMNTVKNIIGVYATPLIQVSTKCLFTNTTPVGAYRGAGRPEGNYYMERLVDTAAREMGIDRVELRRRNHIQPEQMPYKAPSGMLYDVGEFPAVMEQALRAGDWDGYPARQAASRARGKIRGRGIGHYLEVTADAGNEMGGIRFEDDGAVTIITGTLDYGQGHASPFAQVLSAKLGVPFEKIRLLQGDSDQLVAGGGTGGSRSMMQSGGAILEASDIVIERGKQLAAQFLEAAVADIEFHRGRFSIAGTDRGIGIIDLAARLRTATSLPEDLPKTLDVKHIFKGVPSALPNGATSPKLSSTRHRHRGGRQLRDGQRFRRADKPDAGGRPGAWRHRAGDRPGFDRKRCLRRGRAAADRVVHGLRTAARVRSAGARLRESSGSRAHQPARRQGVWGGGVRGFASQQYVLWAANRRSPPPHSPWRRAGWCGRNRMTLEAERGKIDARGSP